MKTLLKPTVEFDMNTVDISQKNCLKKLTKMSALTYGLKVAQLEFFNSVESLIDTFFMKLIFNSDIENCYIYSPAFKKYDVMAKKFCKRVRHINRFENIDEPISKNALVIFTNPSKPDGKYYDLKKLFNHWKKQKALVLIDEAFLDYCNQEGMSKYLKSYERLYIIKSMQRFYSAQGLNMALLCSNEANIKSIKKDEPKYKLSGFDTKYLMAMLNDKNFKKIHQAVNAKNITLFEEVLKCSGLFEKIYESNTNMLLCRLDSLKAKAFKKIFHHAQIEMRSCEHFKFLDEYHIRFTIKTEDEIKGLIESFQKVLQEN